MNDARAGNQGVDPLQMRYNFNMSKMSIEQAFPIFPLRHDGESEPLFDLHRYRPESIVG
jgi:hypothetical protein